MKLFALSVLFFISLNCYSMDDKIHENQVGKNITRIAVNDEYLNKFEFLMVEAS